MQRSGESDSTTKGMGQRELFSKATKAIQVVGKYHLAAAYEEFYVDPLQWTEWSLSHQEQHIAAFSKFCARSYEQYENPTVLGLKHSSTTGMQRARLPEPELFIDAPDTHLRQHHRKTMWILGDPKVTPIRLSKEATETDWHVSWSYFNTCYLSLWNSNCYMKHHFQLTKKDFCSEV